MRSLTLAVALLAVSFTVALAQDQANRLVPLRGLRSLGVVVDDIPEAGITGLDTLSLRVQTELELRRLGIAVADTASAVLYIIVNVLPMSDNESFVYSYDLELSQWVTIRGRSAAGPVLAHTWSRGGVGFAGRSRVTAAIPGSVQRLTQQFLNDYLAANPLRR